MHRVLLQVVLHVILRWEGGDKDVMEAFACVFRRGVFSGTLEVENVSLSVGVQASGLESVELVVQLQALLRGD